jgi:hypothetical protein
MRDQVIRTMKLLQVASVAELTPATSPSCDGSLPAGDTGGAFPPKPDLTANSG